VPAQGRHPAPLDGMLAAALLLKAGPVRLEAVGEPSRSACSLRASAYPVFANQSSGRSPGAGTIPASSTSRSVGT
jgi:hypothetical protein